MLESFEAWDEADAADDVVAEVRSGKSQRGEKRRAAPKSMRCGANLGSGWGQSPDDVAEASRRQTDCLANARPKRGR